ncbi:Os02g0558200 [Oryza sativa Japonica Group]|uniref:Os02g0558200 protein n=1 Tax=Oryza sativa subsp. japonica TaxID=39947 RepID=A0A0P0VKE4_ORYSJ|nr:hypothetical protein EE612_011788 [Oryza sativa]BAS79234.1 Os02g0558200 [Oryza sativa Japonica Group]
MRRTSMTRGSMARSLVSSRRITQTDTVILIVPPRKDAAPRRAKRPGSRSDMDPRSVPTMRPYVAPARITGMKRPDGTATPYVRIPRQYTAVKKMKRVDMWNSDSVPLLKRLRMASSFVLKKSDARSL